MELGEDGRCAESDAQRDLEEEQDESATQPSLDASTADAQDNTKESEQRTSSFTSGDSWEGEPPPLELNYDALKHIASYLLPGTRGKCIQIESRDRGAFHEIRELHFEDGSTCIGRFTRFKNEHVSVLESETATVNYVRRHTSIPVPEIYFVNSNPEHVVGAAFVLMEKLPGRNLYCHWEKLSLKHKLVVVETLTGVLAQLIKLEFNVIGSLSSGDEVGPLCNMAYPDSEGGCGPFENTLDYFLSFMKLGRPLEDSLAQHYTNVRDIVRPFLTKEGSNPIYNAPYSMTHGDFDAQNMLFEWDGGDAPPRLTGIIDWDNSHAGLLYYLCEYPIFIRDVDFESERKFWRQNRVLRKFFVQRLAGHFPRGSSTRRNVKESFRQKNVTANMFRNCFMGRHWPTVEDEKRTVQSYLQAHDPENAGSYWVAAYGGRPYWMPDSEMESDEEVGEVEADGIYEGPLDRREMFPGMLFDDSEDSNSSSNDEGSNVENVKEEDDGKA